MIIVTGPTVITPILRNIPLKKDVSAVLKWEGILIDPIGALVAVLVFEFISVGGEGGFTKTALLEFGKIILFGTTFGFTFAHALAFAINRKLIPHYLLNVVSLSTVLLVFVESEIFAHESGLLAVVVMGMVLGNINLKNIKELLYFKESLSVLLISILFILLAANINIEDLMLLYTWKTALLFAAVILVVRPLAVFASTASSNLKLNERLFISWVGPRGIVAAGIASLFGGKLIKEGVPGAEYITPLVFMVVLGTVLLNATTARFLARIVGVFLKESEGILIVGASEVSRIIGSYLKDNDRHVVLIDSNEANIAKAQSVGLEAFTSNIYSDELTDDIELNDVGYLMALTGNSDINKYAIDKLERQFGENGAFRLLTTEEMNNPESSPKEGLFSHTDDYISLSEVARQHPTIHELKLENSDHLKELIQKFKDNAEMIPLFIKEPSGEINILSWNGTDTKEFTKGQALVYLGKKVSA